MADEQPARVVDRAQLPLSPVLNPGVLWHVASIVSRQLVDLPNGGQEEQDVPIVTDEPVEIAPLSAIERGQPGGLLNTATHRVRLYWVKGVRPAQKVVMHDPFEDVDRTFEVIGVINPHERAWLLELLVVEKV